MMLILLDNSKDMISEKSERFRMTFGQLRTPLSGYKKAGLTVGIDNGCFSEPLNHTTWYRIISEHKDDQELKFVTLPDVVGSARRTLEVFEYFAEKVTQKRCLVAQDGQENLPIPWDRIDAIFIGGSDVFKDGPYAMQIAKTAKLLGKWVHVGRVNSIARVRMWKNIADSCDGTGLSKYDHMLANAVKEIRGEGLSEYQTGDLFSTVENF